MFLLRYFYLILLVLSSTLWDLLESPPIEINSLTSHRSECVQHALHDILPKCMSSGIESLDPQLRKISAIRLSVCEFENAGVLYPFSCHDLESTLDKCSIDLEKSPQHWTTFSGYYREIQTICYEESLPYEKDHILAMFSNVTKVYARFFEDAQSSSDFAAKSYDILEVQLSELHELMIKFFEDSSYQYGHASSEFMNYTDGVKEVLNEVVVAFKYSLEEYEFDISTLSARLKSVSDQYRELSTCISETNLSGIILDTQEKMEQWNEDAELALNKILEGINGVNFVTIANEESSIRISTILKDAERAAIGLEEKLASNNKEIVTQREFVESEFDILANSIGCSFGELLEEILLNSSSQLDLYTSSLVESIETKLNETEERIANHDRMMQHFMDRASNITESISGVVKSIRESTFFRIIEIPKTVTTILASLLKDPFSVVQAKLSSAFTWIVYSVSALLFLFIWVFGSRKNQNTAHDKSTKRKIKNASNIFPNYVGKFLNAIYWVSIGILIFQVVITIDAFSKVYT